MQTTITLVKAGPLLNSGSFSILFELEGPKADDIANKLNISKGFKTAKGWVLTHNKAKRASKLGAVLVTDEVIDEGV